MTVLTVDRARSMGRDRMPLRLKYRGMILSMFQLDSSSRDSDLFIDLEGARDGFTYATALPDHRPRVVEGRLQIGKFGEAFFRIRNEDGPLITAWLDGYYESSTTRSTT